MPGNRETQRLLTILGWLVVPLLVEVLLQFDVATTASVLPPQAPCLPRRQGPVLVQRQAQGKVPGQRTERKQRVALLMDGDVIGHRDFTQIITAARGSGLGDVQRIVLYANPDWGKRQSRAEALMKHGISLVTFRRTKGAAGDPNDMVLAMDAARMVSQGEVDHVALAARDQDFLYLVERLQHWGCNTTLLLPEGQFAGLASAFAAANARVCHYTLDKKVACNMAKSKAVLQTSGQFSIENLARGESGHKLLCEPGPVRRTLHRLGFLPWRKDPLIPAFAKFAYVNKLGKFPVGPMDTALHAACRLHSGCNPRLCKPSPGNLVFVLPQASKDTKVEAGVPFIERDSEGIVWRVLRRLGYLQHDDLAEETVDLTEARMELLEIFCDVNSNVMRGVQWRSVPTLQAREAVVRALLLSPRTYGRWHVAPSDTSIRDWILAQRRRSSCNDTAEPQLLRTMQSCMEERGLQRRRTFLGCVHTLLRHLNACNPNRRT